MLVLIPINYEYTKPAPFPIFLPKGHCCFLLLKLLIVCRSKIHEMSGHLRYWCPCYMKLFFPAWLIGHYIYSIHIHIHIHIHIYIHTHIYIYPDLLCIRCVDTHVFWELHLYGQWPNLNLPQKNGTRTLRWNIKDNSMEDPPFINNL